MALKGKGAEQARLEILLAPTIHGMSVKEACQLNRVTRAWFYRWWRRYEQEGILGLSERSRRPASSPRKIPDVLELAICGMRADHPDWGPRRIRAEIARLGGSSPAKSTIQRVLERNGLISPKPRKRRRYIRFERPCPNDLWQIDALEFGLADETTAHVINVLDDHARYLLASRASLVLDGEAAWDAFEQAASDHGCPRELLSDNGRYFSGHHWDVVSEFERRLWDLGVKTIAATPDHPQTLGKLERFHRTQRDWLNRDGPITNLMALQRRLDVFRWHYNEERPHQAIHDATPGERYRATPAARPSLEEISRSVRRKVWANGWVRYTGWLINLTTEWAGAIVEIMEAGGKVKVVYGSELITSFSTDQPKGYLGTGIRRGKHRIPRRMEKV